MLTAVAGKINAADGKIGAIAGDLADCESMTALMDLMAAAGSSNIDCRQDGGAVGDTRASYIFNSTIAGIEDADALLLIGTNPRWEAPVLNARIRKRYLKGGFAAGLIGPEVDLTYDVAHLGDGPPALDDLLASKGDFTNVLKHASKPMIIIGSGALARDDGAALLAKARQIAEKMGAVSDDWNGFNVLQRGFTGGRT